MGIRISAFQYNLICHTKHLLHTHRIYRNMVKPKLGYWNIRGLGRHVTFLLGYLEVDYEHVIYQAGPGPTFDISVWKNAKPNVGVPFPNLPYYIDEDAGVALSETLVIMRYIANKYKPELLGEGIKEQAQVDHVLHVMHDLKHSSGMQCYGKEVDKSKVASKLLYVIGKLSEYLGDKQYFLGDKLTLPDLYFHESLEQANFITDGAVYTKYENFKKFHDRIEALPTVKKFLDSVKKQPFNNTMAALNDFDVHA